MNIHYSSLVEVRIGIDNKTITLIDGRDHEIFLSSVDRPGSNSGKELDFLKALFGCR